MSLAFWICGAITAISACVSLGYSIAALRPAGPAEPTGAMYAFARSLALAAVAIAAPFTQSAPFVVAVAIAMTIVQGTDAVIGAIIRDRIKTVGPAATAAANLGALIWLALA